MKTSAETRRRSDPQGDLAERYFEALQDYISGGGEQALGRGYEAGRTALADGCSILEILQWHHDALQRLLNEGQDPSGSAAMARYVGAFLAEALSPYEMTHRGFREAVSTLRQLNEMLEMEIQRVAHALHDDAGQMLVAVHLALADLDREIPPALHARVVHLKELLMVVDEQLRRMSHELRPTILDDLGLVPAIGFLADGVSRRTGQVIVVHASVEERLPVAIETPLYRIVQEALNNASRHASAKRVHIQLERLNGQIHCAISDDGKGFDLHTILARKTDAGLGLQGMQERLNALGGSMRIQTSPGRGTSLFIQIPLERPYENANRIGR